MKASRPKWGAQGGSWLTLALGLTSLCLALAPASGLLPTRSLTAQELVSLDRLTAPAGHGDTGGFGHVPCPPESPDRLTAAAELALPATGPSVCSSAVALRQRTAETAAAPPARAVDRWFGTREFLDVATTALRDHL